MRFEQILDENRRFLVERTPRPLPTPASVPLIVIACFDPRLDEMLLPALGLEPGEAFVVRTAGAFVPPDSSTLRALMVAVFLFEAREIVVVGHSSCRMASFDTAAFIESFRARGVAREAFGSTDLREWAGAVPSPRRAVELTIASILSHPAYPRDLVVSGAVLNDTSGALEPVAEASEAVREEAPASDAGEARAVVEEPSPPGEDPLQEAVDGLVRVIRSNARWRREVERLKQELAREGHHAAKLNALSRFAKQVGHESIEVPRAFERLKREILSSGGPLDREKMLRLFQSLMARL